MICSKTCPYYDNPLCQCDVRKSGKKAKVKSQQIERSLCKSVNDHEIGYKTIGGFPGHEHVHHSGEQVCFKCGKTLREIVENARKEEREKVSEIIESAFAEELGTYDYDLIAEKVIGLYGKCPKKE